MSSIRSLDAIYLSTAVLFFLCGNVCVTAQSIRSNQSGGLSLMDESSVFVPAPREILRPLIRAQNAIEEKEFGRAVALLGEVLSDASTEDFLVTLPGGDGLAISLRNRAQQLLGSIDQKERKLYELRYGVQAKQMLAQAIEAQEFDSMSHVMRRFFYTPAGYDAAMLIGHHHLDQGHPIAAAFCFQRVVDTESARAVHDPEASVLLATCWMLADWPDRARETLTHLKSRRPNGNISFSGNQVQLFGDGEDPIAWLQNLMGNSPLSSNRIVQHWVMYGGNPQRNARSGSGFPLFIPKWSVPTLNNPDQERLVREKLADLIFADAATIPAVHPIAMGNTVVMRSFDKLIGVDFETGKRVWVFPPWDTESFFENDMALDQDARNDINKGPLAQRMLFDSVYGQVSSDGKTIFAVPSPGFTSGNYAKFVLQGGVLIDHPLSIRSYNELKAVDVAREGAFRWEVGGQTGLDEPLLAKSFFLGPPLPLDGSLYAICEQDGETRLVVLDPETGKLQWSQQLASTEKGLGKPSRHPYRRLAGATPSFSDGLIICPTGARSIVAVELSTRSLLWGYQYGAPNRQSDPRILPDKLSGSVLDDGAWRNSAITIADGCVLYTPVDSQELICLDLLNGHPKWTGSNGVAIRGVPRDDSLLLGCVEDGAAILIGLDRIRSINLKDGKQRWATDIRSHGRPSGQGYASNGNYYLPTTHKKLIRVDLAKGEVTKTVATTTILGNLICYKGMVISHGVDHLAAFPQDEPNRLLVEGAEARGELTPTQLAIKAQLQMQAGEIREAAENIAKAYDAEPDPGKETILLDLIVQLIQKDFSAGDKIASRYQTQLLQGRKNEYLAAQIDGRIKNGDWVQAMDSVIDILKQPSELISGDSSYFLSSATPTVPDSVDENVRGREDRILVRLDRWLQGRTDFIFDHAKDEQISVLLARIEDFLGSTAGADVIWRHDLMRLVSLDRVSPGLRLAIAEELFQPQIEQHNHRRTDLDESSNVPPGSNLMAERLRAFGIYRSLMSETSLQLWGSQIDSEILNRAYLRAGSMIANTPTPVSSAQYLSRINDSGSTAAFRSIRESANDREDTVLNWKRGLVSSFYEPKSQTFTSKQLVRHVLDFTHNGSNQLEQFQFRFFANTGQVEISGSRGELLARFRARPLAQAATESIHSYVRGQVSFYENLMLVTIGNELFAIDWLAVNEEGVNPVVWTRQVQSKTLTGPAPPARPGIWGDYAVSSYYRTRFQSMETSPPSPNGVCYIDQTRLICVDALTGEMVWQRPDIMPRSELLGDENNLIVWNVVRRTAKIIDVASGRLIRELDLDRQLGSVWYKTRTGLLLSNVRTVANLPGKEIDAPPESRRNGSGNRIQVINHPSLAYYDFLKAEIVWQREFPASTRAAIAPDEMIGVLPPKGDFELVDMYDGETKHSVVLNLPESENGSEQEKVRTIGIEMTPPDSYLLKMHTSANNSTRVSSRNSKYYFRSIFPNQKFWNGYLVSIDRQSGKSNWRRPARIENFQFTQNLPYDSPYLFLSRRVDYRQSPSAEKLWLHVVVLDARTGEVVANEKTVNEYFFDFRIHVQPETGRVSFGLMNSNFEFVSSDDQRTPRPVAHLTESNSSLFDEQDVAANYDEDQAEIDAEREQLIEQLVEAQKELKLRQAEMRKRLEQQKRQPVDPKKDPDK